MNVELEEIRLQQNPQAWTMVWAGEPDRKVEVTMTYEDLKIIYEMVKQRREERESKRSDPDA